MKYIFVSDIHGDAEKLEYAFEILNREEANKLVILGDTSNNYNEVTNNRIINMLNDNKRRVEVIRGNNDSMEFERNLDFEIFDDDILYINGFWVSITHGHIYNCYRLPQNCKDIFIQGHTHIPMFLEHSGRILANPGSMSRPRGTDLKCYIVIDENSISLKELGGNLIKEIKLVKKEEEYK